jgi:hypothetical protein
VCAASNSKTFFDARRGRTKSSLRSICLSEREEEKENAEAAFRPNCISRRHFKAMHAHSPYANEPKNAFENQRNTLAANKIKLLFLLLLENRNKIAFPSEICPLMVDRFQNVDHQRWLQN